MGLLSCTKEIIEITEKLSGKTVFIKQNPSLRALSTIHLDVASRHQLSQRLNRLALPVQQ